VATVKRRAGWKGRQKEERKAKDKKNKRKYASVKVIQIITHKPIE
jgi:hypothetical protein